MSDEARPPQTTASNSSLQLLQQLQQFEAQSRQHQLTVDSPAIKATSDMMASLMGRGSVDELRRSASMGDRVLGNLIPMIGAAGMGFMGMSPSSMILANQNAFTDGGMRLASRDGTSMLPLSGFNPISDQLATRAWDTVQSRFFQPGGALNLDTTYGASRDDIAAVMHDLQRRGAYAGQTAGTIENLTPERLGQLRSDASQRGDKDLMKELDQMTAGDPYVTPDPGMSGRMADWTQKTLKAVTELRAVMGNFDPQDILAEMERLTGINITSPAGLDSAVASVKRRASQGMLHGMSSAQALEFNVATASTMDAVLSQLTGAPSGSYAGAAAGMSEAVDRMSLAAYAEQRAGGGRRHLGEVGASMATDISRLMTETPEMAEALLAAQNMSGAPRQALLDSVDAYGKAGTVAQREEARRNMGTVLEQQYGMRSGAMVNVHGADAVWAGLTPEMQERAANTLGRTNQAAMVGDFQRFGGMYSEGSYYASAMGGSERAANFAQALFQNVPRAQLDEIQKAMGSGGAGLSSMAGKLTGALPGYGDTYETISRYNDALMKSSGGRVGIGDFIGQMQTQMDLSGTMGSMVTPGGLNAQDRAMFDQSQVDLWGKGMNPLGIKQQLEQGFFGGKSQVPLEDQVMLAYAKAAGKDISYLNMTADGSGLDVDAAGAGKLREHFRKVKVGDLKGVDLWSVLGVSSDEELAKLLKTSRGAAAITGLLSGDKDQIAGVDVGPDGKPRIAFALDPDKLKDDYNKDISDQKGEGKDLKPQEKAAEAARGNQAVQLNLQLPTGNVLSLFGDISRFNSSKLA